MLRNYINITFRNILKQKGYAAINIIGLSFGLAATILMMLFVQHELSFDQYHTKKDRIFRVSRGWYNADGSINLHLGHTAPPFSPLLKNYFDGIVEESVRFMNDDPLIVYGEKKIKEERFFFADETFLKVFDWKLLKGDPSTALKNPNDLILSESAAKRFFGEEDPIGKTLSYNNQFDLTVSAVMQDMPDNSHFTMDFIASMAPVSDFYGGEKAFMSNFGSNNFGTYLLLADGHGAEEVEAGMASFIDKHVPMFNDVLPSKSTFLELMPITDVHLHSHLDSETETNGDIKYVYIFTAIALFTLIIACINFVNLTTARSVKRAREVGVRKVMGAQKSMLIKQFLVESTVFSLLALLLSILVVVLFLPWFNQFSGKSLSMDVLGNPFIPLMLLGITIVVGVLAGSYPAFYLSKFDPAQILKSQGKKAGRKFNLRSVLVVVQFLISILLIISVGVIKDQINFVKSKSLGFESENKIVLPMNRTMLGQYSSIKQQFEKESGIEQVGLASRVPSGSLLDSQGTKAEVEGEMKNINFRVADVHVDFDFLSLIETKFIAGRDFDAQRASDSTEAFVLNHAAIKAIGWKNAEEAIDKKFSYGSRNGFVIGVVEDFHFESLKQSIAPVVFLVTSGRSRNLVVDVNPQLKTETLEFLQEQYAYLMPGFPFEYFKLDERFNTLYQQEEQLIELGTYFSALAIVIACLGLMGLASFTAEQRFKEIGIRKVLGANANQIIFLLTKNFISLVAVGFILAIPIAWVLMQSWLEAFAYHTNIRVGTIVIAGTSAFLIAFLTVGGLTWKAANANPTDAMKDE